MHTSDLSLNIPKTDKKRIVIIGGGFGGITLAKKLKKKGFQVVLFDRHNYHTFQPLLYQVATAGLEPDSIAGPLRKLIDNHKDFFFRLAEVKSIDLNHNIIKTEIDDLNYDFLVLACGTVTNFFGNTEIQKRAFPLKKITHALDLRSQILQNFEKAVMTNDEQERQSLMNYVVVGGGPTGVEVSGALGELKLHVLPHDYPDLDFRKMEIYLVEAQPKLLSGMSDSAGDKAYQYLKRFDVNVHIQKLVKSYDGSLVKLSDGSTIPTNTLIWAAGVKGDIVGGLAAESLHRDRILVDEVNRVKGTDNVFTIGDLAIMQSKENPNGHPMLAPVAIQQGRLLAENLDRMVKGKAIKPFHYKDKGSMATIGRNRAVVDLGGKISFGGLFAWFVWMFIHLISIIGFRSKLVVFSNWVWNYFTYDRGTRLIIRPFIPRKE